MTFIQRFKYLTSQNIIANIITALSFFIYLFILIFFSHTSRPMLDEGLYTYKGWLFLSGRYTPYQDYGPWMNHMPFSFLIPGTMQVLFGPGIRTGRYFAIFLAVMIIIGLYLIARRLSGKWVAMGVVLVLSLNFPVIQFYSRPLSEGLVSCMIVWILYLSLGKGQPQWQILLATFLSAVLVLTRINMFPIFLLLMLYIVWENGWAKGRWAILVAIVSFFGLHILFGPGVFTLWNKWLSSFFGTLLDFSIDTLSDSPDYVDISSNTLIARISSLFMTIQNHFVVIIGTISTWLLWPRRNGWKEQSHFRIAIFLSTTFGILFLAHALVTLGKDYCVFCFSLYTSFFHVIGILLVAISWQLWRKKVSVAVQVLLIFLILTTFVGIAFNLLSTVDLKPFNFIEKIFSLSSQALLSPTDSKEMILKSLFNLFGVQDERDSLRLFKRMNASYYGFLGGLFFLTITGLIWYVRRRILQKTIPFIHFVLYIFLAMGLFLFPFRSTINGLFVRCNEDQIQNFENLGEEISSIIPANSQIYWLAYSPSLLLYMSDVKIYPPQLNGYNSYKYSLNSDQLYREGFWNRELAERWANNSSYMILTQITYDYDEWLVNRYIDSGLYREVFLDTSSFYTCDETNQLNIRLFKKAD